MRIVRHQFDPRQHAILYGGIGWWVLQNGRDHQIRPHPRDLALDRLAQGVLLAKNSRSSRLADHDAVQTPQWIHGITGYHREAKHPEEVTVDHGDLLYDFPAVVADILTRRQGSRSPDNTRHF